MASPFALQAAQQKLQQQIEAAVHQFATGAPLELDLSFEERGMPATGTLSDAPESLADAVRKLIHAFNHEAVVQEANLHARHVTALDSDGDGHGSVNIRFVYRDEIEGDDPSDLAAGEGDNTDDQDVIMPGEAA